MATIGNLVPDEHGLVDIIVETKSPNLSVPSKFLNHPDLDLRRLASLSVRSRSASEMLATSGFSGLQPLGTRAFGLTISASDVDELLRSQDITRVYHNTVFEVPYQPGIGVAATVDNDDNWGFDFLSAGELHQLGLLGESVKVGVLDTGIDAQHPTFKGVNIAGFMSFDQAGKPSERTPFDSMWHGTHVCSILSGADDGKKRGLAPKAELYVGQVFNGWEGSVASIKGGLIWMRDVVRPDILNLSLGWPGLHDEWFTEIDELTRNGTIVCAASGNEFTESLKHRSPANYAVEGLISVGANDTGGNVWPQSGGGDFIWPNNTVMSGRESTLPILTAPGAEIISASPNGTHRNESGTSMAAPHVSGLIAALLSQPGASKDGVITLVRNSLIDQPPSGFDDRYGFGCISGGKIIEGLRNLQN